MGTTLPGINQLPSLQSFSMNKENRYPLFQQNSNHINDSYFELKPQQITHYHVQPIVLGSTPNYSYQQSQLIHHYNTPHHNLQSISATTRQSIPMSLYQPPLISPTEPQQGYVKPLRSQSQDSNLRLPSIQQLVSPIPSGQEIQRAPQSHPFTQQIHMPTTFPSTTSIPSNQYTYSPPHSMHHASHIQPKKIRKRTRTGCLTCRKRRIKCDERKPGCMNCEKSKKCCAGYVDATKKKK